MAPPPDMAPETSAPLVPDQPVSGEPQIGEEDKSGSAWLLVAGAIALAALAAAAALRGRRRLADPEDLLPATAALEPVQPPVPAQAAPRLEEPAFPAAARSAEASAPATDLTSAPPSRPLVPPRPALVTRPLRVLYGREAVEAFSRPPRRPQPVR